MADALEIACGRVRLLFLFINFVAAGSIFEISTFPLFLFGALRVFFATFRTRLAMLFEYYY